MNMKYRIIEETFKNSIGDSSKIYKVQYLDKCHYGYDMDIYKTPKLVWFDCFGGQKFPSLELARSQLKWKIEKDKSKMILSNAKVVEMIIN